MHAGLVNGVASFGPIGPVALVAQKKKTILILVLLGIGLSAIYLLWQYRLTLIPQQPQLPTHFLHKDHEKTPCAQCHHNYVDDTGGGTCYACHKHTKDLNLDMEAMFHRFCWQCHQDEQAKGEESGPIRSCQGCHRG